MPTGSTAENKTTTYFYNSLQPVKMPSITMGTCSKCRKYFDDLGNGLCVTCFDATVTNRMDRHSH